MRAPYNVFDKTVRLGSFLNFPQLSLKYLAHELSHSRAGTVDNAYMVRNKDQSITFFNKAGKLDPLNVDESINNADTYAWFIYELSRK